MAEKIASMYAEVTADTSGLEKGLARTKDGLERTAGAAKKTETDFKKMADKFNVASTALNMTAATARQVWQVLEQGAALNLATDRFDNLTASIGTTSDALLNDLGKATGGMMSNAEQIAGASQIISLGLADNQKDVVDLAGLIGNLGWDMQQVILTFANNSKMRLDALGLSVTDVETRAKALEAQGYNTDKAFDLAVIQAGQAKLELLGSAADTGAGAMMRLEAAWANVTDTAKGFIALRSEGAIIGLANTIDAVGEASEAGHSNMRNFMVVLAELGRGGSQSAWLDEMVASMEEEEAQTVENVRAYGYLINQYKLAAEGQAALTAARGFSSEKLAAYMSLEQMYGRQGEAIGDSAANAWRVREEAMESYSIALEEGVGLESMYGQAAMDAANASMHSTAVMTQAQAAQDAYNVALSDSFKAFETNTGALTEYQGMMHGGAVATQSLNDQLYSQIAAVTDDANMLAIAGVALGQFDQAQADAMLNAALLEEKIREQAAAWDGTAAGLEAVKSNIQGYIDMLNGIPTSVNTEVHTTYTQTNDPPAHVGQPTSPGGGGGGMDSGFASGVSGFIVPPGYPNDSYRVGLTSGERVDVAPAGKSGGGNGMTFTGAITINAAPGQDGRQLFNEFMQEAGRQTRLRRVGMG